MHPGRVQRRGSEREKPGALGVTDAGVEGFGPGNEGVERLLQVEAAEGDGQGGLRQRGQVAGGGDEEALVSGIKSKLLIFWSLSVGIPNHNSNKIKINTGISVELNLAAA